MSCRSLLFLILSCGLAGGSTAVAQRTVDLDAYAIPDQGAIAIVVAQQFPATGAFAEVDRATSGALQRAAASAGFRGERGTTLNLPGLGGYDQVLLIGIGEDSVSPRLLEDIGGLLGQAGQASAAKRIDLLWPDDSVPAAGAHLALGASLGGYRFRHYRSPKPDAPQLGQGEIVLRVADPEGSRKAWERDWRHVADGVEFARNLATEPGNAVYPQRFVERAQAAFADLAKVRIEVLDETEMAKLGMGSILAVGSGSARPPRLLVVRYDGGTAGAAPIAFVGKGITFDTGGISLKPNEDMWRMKYDLSGAAAAVGAVLALARREAKLNVVAVAALAENMPSGSAGRPGDVVRTASGQTYEVMSTDAEGRMVLVDALWYVQTRDRPRAIIDIATLTGSQVTALGDEYGGLFARDETLATQLLAAGAASGEELWRLPLHPSYAKDLESPIADLRHSGGRKAGAGLGAYFIGAWVSPEIPWAHLDIASMAWRDAPALPTVPEGASGFGVRLFDRYVRDHVEGVL